MKQDLFVESQDYGIRYTSLEDLQYLQKWLALPDIQKGFSFETPAETEEMTKIWIAYSRYKCSLTATYKGIPIGIGTLFLMPYIKLIHHALGYIVVDPDFHRKGVGTSLVRNLDHLGAKYFRLERMQYEIFGDNPLAFLLQKQGYEQLFEQEKYLKEKDRYLSRRIFEKVYDHEKK